MLQDLNQYEATDLPAYRRWFHRTLCAVLTETREPVREVRRLEEQAPQIQTLRLVNRISWEETYRLATEAGEHPDN